MPAMSSPAGISTDIAGSLAASIMSYSAGSISSWYSPVARSTMWVSTIPKRSSMSITGSSRPATRSTFFFMFRASFCSCIGFRITAVAETSTEQTSDRLTATMSTFLMLSRLNPLRAPRPASWALRSSDTAFQPPLDVGLHHEIVDDRREYVAEQDGQHDPFRIGRVDHPDQRRQHADEDGVDPSPGIGLRGTHRVRGHEHGAEQKAAGDQVPVPGHGEHRIRARIHLIEQQHRHDQADDAADDDAPGSDAGIDQYGGADQAGQRRGLADGALDGADESLPPGETRLGDARHAVDGGQPERGRTGEAFRRGPHRVAGHLHRVGEVEERAAGQCRVQEVLAGAAEDLLADHDAEADAQRRLPQRRGGSEDQRIQQR